MGPGEAGDSNIPQGKPRGISKNQGASDDCCCEQDTGKYTAVDALVIAQIPTRQPDKRQAPHGSISNFPS